jgi:hypothetical protein
MAKLVRNLDNLAEWGDMFTRERFRLLTDFFCLGNDHLT